MPPVYARMELTIPTPDQRVSFSGMPVYGNRSYAAGDEWLARLQNTQRDRVFRTILDNIGPVKTSARLMGNLLAQVVYTIVPANDTPEAIADAAEIDALWRNMEIPWSRVVFEIGSTSPMWGWSFHETVYNKDAAGMVGLRGFYLVRHDSRYTWDWDNDGRNLIALEQMTKNGQYSVIPLVKALHFVPDTTTGDPEGCPLLRNLYTDYIGYVNSTTAMDVGVKKDATGSLHQTVPLDVYAKAGKDQSIPENAAATTLLKAVQKDVAGFQNGERSGFTTPPELDTDGKPTGWSLTQLPGGGQRQFSALENARFYQNNMMVTLLTQFLMLSSTKSGMGSQGGLSSSQMELLDLSLGGMLDAMCDAVTKQAIRPLSALRGLSTCPRMTHGPIRPRDLKALADVLGVAVKAGIVSPTPELESWLLDIFGAPAKTAKGDL